MAISIFLTVFHTVSMEADHDLLKGEYRQNDRASGQIEGEYFNEYAKNAAVHFRK